MQITINGRQVEVLGESNVLEVARREGINIPTLCYHPALEPYGACRLCIVEVIAGGRPGLTAACVLPLTNGLVIETESPKVHQVRKVNFQLLLASCPDASEIKELAQKYGVYDTPYVKSSTHNKCALCGQCVRVCEKIGARAIGFAYRGPLRKVISPFEKTPDVCLACRACENICPMGIIKFTEEAGTITGEPWQGEVELARCSRCGKPFASKPLLEHLKVKTGLKIELCMDCRKDDAGQSWLLSK